ncbi:MAG: chromosome segregation ATPase [Ancylomarina sp.]|jgi:chromosome segregation ATPase
MNKKLLILSIMPLMLVSCVVSKRKYEELDYAKRKSDAQVRKLGKDNKTLDSKLNQTLAEYNEMKNSMAESNAQKNVEIDELSSELFSMASDTTSLKEKLHETLGNYKFAQDRNAENEAIINKLNDHVKRLKAESSQITNDLNASLKDKEWESKKVALEKLRLKEKVAQKDNQLAKVKKEMEVVNGKIVWLRKVKKQNDAEIEKLTNQMNLYKKEYEKAIDRK